MRPIRPIRLIQTGMILLLALATPVVAVLDEKFWFEKRIALAGAAVVLLALLAVRVWVEGYKGGKGFKGQDLGWLLFGAALLVAAVVPAGRIGNLATPDLWVGVGAVAAYFAIKNTTTSSRQIKLGFVAAATGVVAALGISFLSNLSYLRGTPLLSGVPEQLQLLQHSPIFGEFREFRMARLGALQVASGLGTLGVLGVLTLAYQLVWKFAKEIFKSSSIWWKALNLLVLVLLAGFLILPHPALTLFPLAVVAALGCGISPVGEGYKGGKGFKGTIERLGWAVLVGLLIVVILGSSYGLGRVVWGETKFREALTAANRNEGITTYYALLEAIKRNPYEIRYHLLASQIDLALANSIAAQAQTEAGGSRVEAGNEGGSSKLEESTPSAGLTAQDQNNILILIQQAVVEGKAAINLDPENSFLWQNLASIYRGLIGVAGGAEDWALKCYQRAAELSPQDPNPPLRLGEIHLLGGNFQGAREAFEEAAQLNPNWPLARYDLAVALNAMGEVDKAIEALRETLALLPADDPSREQVEKDLEFLKGDATLRVDKETLRVGVEEATSSAELREATSSAEVEAPPPPVGPEEATESAQPEGPLEVVP